MRTTAPPPALPSPSRAASTRRVAAALMRTGLLHEGMATTHREDAAAFTAGSIDFAELVQRRAQRGTTRPPAVG